MNWTDIFPVMSENALEDFRAGVQAEEREEFEKWLGIAAIHHARLSSSAHYDTGRISNQAPMAVRQSGVAKSSSGQIPAKSCRHLVSATLFWKQVMSYDPDLPEPTRERLVTAKRLGMVKRLAPWASYVEPLLHHTRGAVERNSDAEFRLYLASDLDFLIPDLTACGWNVYLMKSSSIRYCPGGFWRFLALEEKGRMVTIIDTDRMSEIDGEIARTRMMESMKLGLWRVPAYYEGDNDRKSKAVRYRPILGGHFGAKGGIAIRELIECFIWHSRRGTLPVMADIPGRGAMPMHWVDWPGYGFDEWFLLAALYPRLVRGGTLSFVPSFAASMLLPVDIEYVTWANRRSEIVHF